MVANDVEDRMEAAAEQAERDLVSLMNELDEIQKKGAKAILRWFASHYMGAGYKKLGKICVKVSRRDAG